VHEGGVRWVQDYLDQLPLINALSVTEGYPASRLGHPAWMTHDTARAVHNETLSRIHITRITDNTGDGRTSPIFRMFDELTPTELLAITLSEFHDWFSISATHMRCVCFISYYSADSVLTWLFTHTYVHTQSDVCALGVQFLSGS
jgi:hypothetical protein